MEGVKAGAGPCNEGCRRKGRGQLRRRKSEALVTPLSGPTLEQKGGALGTPPSATELEAQDGRLGSSEKACLHLSTGSTMGDALLGARGLQVDTGVPASRVPQEPC